MACLPVSLLAWLPQCLQPVISPLDSDTWDYGGNQEAPHGMVIENTVRPHNSAFHHVSSEKSSRPQQVQGKLGKYILGGILDSIELIPQTELMQSFQPRDNCTLPDIQPPQQVARRSFSIPQPTPIKSSRLFTQQDVFWDKSPPLSPSHKSGIETNTHQSYQAPVLEGSIHIRSTDNYLYAEPFLQILPIIPLLPIQFDLLWAVRLLSFRTIQFQSNYKFLKEWLQDHKQVNYIYPVSAYH